MPVLLGSTHEMKSGALFFTAQHLSALILTDFLNDARRVQGGGGGSPRKGFLGFLLLKSPFLGFQVIQTGYWPDFNIECVLIIKNVLL